MFILIVGFYCFMTSILAPLSLIVLLREFVECSHLPHFMVVQTRCAACSLQCAYLEQWAASSVLSGQHLVNVMQLTTAFQG